MVVTDGDYLPLIAIAPQYPTRAAQRGIEGWALVSFTVDEAGNVVADSVMVQDAEPQSIFDRNLFERRQSLNISRERGMGKIFQFPGSNIFSGIV